MSDSASGDLKAEPQVVASATASPKTTAKKGGNVIVLIPQPSDDPEDPLVSQISTSRESDVKTPSQI